jgi:hypothetical protein
LSATLAEIRAGLQTALDTIPGPDTSAYMTDSPNDLTLQVMGPDAVEYDLAMQRGLDRWTMIVQAFSGSPDNRAAQENLDAWIAPTGTYSVKAAIEKDITLGGIVQSARVARTSGYRIYDFPNQGGRMLGTEFFVDIYNTGK